MTYLDMWRSGTFPEKQQVSKCAGDGSWIQKAAVQLYRRNVPLLHMSRYIIPHDSVLPGLPPSALVLQATNTAARRSGYEAR